MSEAELLTVKKRLASLTKSVPDFLRNLKVGSKVRVNYLITEGNKKRVQVFEGIVIAIKKPNNPDGSFTVRKISFGVGVERTYPIYSPNIVKVEFVSQAKVRRAKLYFLRSASTEKEARLKTKHFLGKTVSQDANADGDNGMSRQELANQTTKELG
ncbi:MAG: 50S ribosomal protein L19 [Deltaproteobacteria bacterium]|nr:50S ribosomal protein L19 [Deltaproteobacteria bacterium]MCX7952729.1 50S ribosomal protein L19 [Deltaproteobacteria bacterium]